MSTTVEIIDSDQFNEALSDVRSDASDTNWFLCGHTDNADELVFVGSGSGGVSELAGCLDDGRYMYGLVRSTVTIDMSDTTKFSYIYWVGKDVPFVKKGKFGVKSGAVKKIFEPYQVSFEFDGDDISMVTEDLIRNKLEESSGTKSKVLDAAEAKDRPERGFTAGVSSGPKSPTGAGNIGSSIGKQGTSYSGIKGTAKGGSSVKVSDDVYDAITAVRSDEDESATWLCAKFEDNNLKKPLCLAAVGNEQSEFNQTLIDSEVACVLIRTSDVVDDIATVKFAYILWVGEKVKPMSKGRISTCKGELEELFKPFHVHIHATQPNEVRPQVIQDKIGSASGSKSNIK